jgi:hypothetical protein
MLEGLRFVTFVTFSAAYPLVNIQKTRGHYHFCWVNKLFLWPFSIAMFNYQRVVTILGYLFLGGAISLSSVSCRSRFWRGPFALQCFVRISDKSSGLLTVSHILLTSHSYWYLIHIPLIIIPSVPQLSPEYPTNIPLFSYQYRRLTWTSAMAAMAELVSVAVRNLQK